MVLAAVARTGAAVTCYSCGPGHGAGAAVEAGSCAEPHHAEYCAGVDWCVKTWRGNTSAMAGEHVYIGIIGTRGTICMGSWDYRHMARGWWRGHVARVSCGVS